MCIPVFVFMACIEFSNAYMLGQRGNTVCQLYPSEDYIADSYKNISPNCIVYCLCHFNRSDSIFGCATEMVLKGFYKAARKGGFEVC